MRPNILYALASTLILAFTFAACEKEGIERSLYYTIQVPIYAPRAAVQDSVERQEPRSLCAPGNIFARGRYLFVNEPHVGWHVFDNTRPEAPESVAFWRLPGSTQLSYANGRFLTDCYGDIVTLDVDVDLNVSIHGFNANVLATNYYTRQASQGVIIGYREERVRETDVHRYYWGESSCTYCDGAGPSTGGGPSVSNTDFGAGVQASGSFSRFAVRDTYLYVVSEGSIATYNIGDSLHRTPGFAWGDGLETAFVSGDHLYAGAAAGVYIYSLEDPAQPTLANVYRHVQGCDPVAVEGDYAVVTVRDGRRCGSTSASINRLIVLDVHNPAQPVEISVTPMRHPHGVALRGDRVYVCEGTHGLRVFAFDPDRGKLGPELEGSDLPATDVMLLPYAAGLKVMTVSPIGFIQYAVEPASAPAPVSTIAVTGC